MDNGKISEEIILSDIYSIYVAPIQSNRSKTSSLKAFFVYKSILLGTNHFQQKLNKLTN